MPADQSSDRMEQRLVVLCTSHCHLRSVILSGANEKAVVSNIDHSYNEFARLNGSGPCWEATMPRDTLVVSSRREGQRGIHTSGCESLIGSKASCLESPRLKGGILTNGERALSISG
jgi:hypothetical protein